MSAASVLKPCWRISPAERSLGSATSAFSGGVAEVVSVPVQPEIVATSDGQAT